MQYAACDYAELPVPYLLKPELLYLKTFSGYGSLLGLTFGLLEGLF